MAYLFVVTETCRDVVLFLAIAAFAITSMEWLGIGIHLPALALG